MWPETTPCTSPPIQIVAPAAASPSSCSTSKRAALRGHVARGGQAGADQPLRQARVQAAGDGVLRHAQPGHEGAYLEGGLGAGRLGADHAELDAAQRGEVGRERAHLGRIAQHQRAPAGAVVDPLVAQHVAARHAQRGGHALHLGFLQRPAAAQRRRGEGQPLRPRGVAPHPHQAHAALLHDDARRARHAAGFQPGPAAAQRGVTRERQLAAGGEDAHPVVRPGLRGRQQEGRLRQVGPARQRGHPRVVETGGVVHDGQRVARQRRGAEHVDLVEAAGAARGRRAHGTAPCSASASTRPSAATPCSMRSAGTVTKDSRSVFACLLPSTKNGAPGT
jgi:hypothetical protein